MENRFPQRKSTRLKHYDYSTPGGYFLTLCAAEHRCIFGTIVGDGVLDVPHIALSDIGMIVDRRIREMSAFYSHILIDHYVVMPNHVHLLISVRERNIDIDGPSRTPAPTNEDVPLLVSALKRLTNREAGQSLWQRGYHDHILRDEADYRTRWRYIEENPARWNTDELFSDI